MPNLYELRVELLNVRPVVWRKVLIPADMPLLEMAAALVGAMGWNASYLLAIEIDGVRYDIDLGEGMHEGARDIKGIMAQDVLRPGIDAALQYDFGDDWWHSVEVLDHRPVQKGDRPPCCVDGEHACPPDDSGGPFGFLDMLDMAADPSHPDHEDLKEWLDQYHAGAFSLRRSNQNMKLTMKAYLNAWPS